jgi:hypothetical protein
MAVKTREAGRAPRAACSVKWVLILNLAIMFHVAWKPKTSRFCTVHFSGIFKFKCYRTACTPGESCHNEMPTIVTRDDDEVLNAEHITLK